MQDDSLQVEYHDGVARVWLNRPQRHNAFDENMIEQLHHSFAALDKDPRVRVVVIGGRGKSFCAGGDLAWMQRMAEYDDDENLEDAGRLAAMLWSLYRLRKPTIARVHGAALAGGTGLVAACDIAVATSDASFGTTEVRLGLVPATISPYVIRAIGERAARRYFQTAERFDAQTAHRLGLVHELCTTETLDDTIDRLVQSLQAGAPEALSASKRLIADVSGQTIDAELMMATSRRIAQVRSGQEAREGIAAFFDKRPPAWQDRSGDA